MVLCIIAPYARDAARYHTCARGAKMNVSSFVAALTAFAAGPPHSAGPPGGAGHATAGPPSVLFPSTRRALTHENGHDCLVTPVCFKAVTRGATNDDGYLIVQVDSGSGYVRIADGWYDGFKCVPTALAPPGHTQHVPWPAMPLS